jgi:NAD(P)-dependent dehydrogenase (short-subunit alcohol dehydrogenase family)
LREQWPDPDERIVILGGSEARRAAFQQQYPEALTMELSSEANLEELSTQLEALGPLDHIIWLAPELERRRALTDEAVITGQRQGVLQLYRLIRALLALDYGTRNLGWTVVTVQTQAIDSDGWSDPTHASVHGLMGALAKEYAGWQIRVIDAAAGETWNIGELLRAPADPEGNALALRGGHWRRLRLPRIRLVAASGSSYRHNGVYVVIGGAGGIGEAWSEYMIRNHQARIVWIGRRQQDAQITRRLRRLAELGPEPLYIAADAGNRAALERACAQIRQTYGQINGIVQSAFVLRDSSLARMDEQAFAAALSAKVDTTVRLAQVFAEEELDFVLFFSSLQSFKKYPGQSNYAAGCTFADAFALELGRCWECAVKVINWGYWGSVGAVASQEYRDRMARAGVGSIEPQEGMAILERLLASQLDQLGYMKIAPASWEESIAADGLAAYATNIPSVASKLRAYRARPVGV